MVLAKTQGAAATARKSNSLRVCYFVQCVQGSRVGLTRYEIVWVVVKISTASLAAADLMDLELKAASGELQHVAQLIFI